MSARLSVDWIACDGRGLCAELAPELIEQDEWGFPVVMQNEIPAGLVKVARRAVRDCPVMALRLVETADRAGAR
jgi:ferredoxin